MMKRALFVVVLLLAVVVAGYGFVVARWSYSTGERAGWVQKFSRKGWVCKTWEGELAIVSMPGTTPEKFYFTVWDPAVADKINAAMGERVALHYQQKVGLPGSCFGETDYWVDEIRVFKEQGASPAQSPPPQPPQAPPPPPPGDAPATK